MISNRCFKCPRKGDGAPVVHTVTEEVAELALEDLSSDTAEGPHCVLEYEEED
jgi:hypothetical protein